MSNLDPLTKRFSALGTPVSATWMSGTLDAVEDGVRSALPPGQLLSSSNLDALIAQGSFRAKAYLAADSDTVVLVSLGQ